jgi:maltose O-acetyltransferase
MVRPAQALRILFYRLMSNAPVGGCKPRLGQPLLSLGRGRIRFEHGVQIGYFPSAGFFNGICHLEARGESAEIVVGEGSNINNNFTAVAESTHIHIGKRCLIGVGVTIYDSDFHGLAIADRSSSGSIKRAPVSIGDDVFIGSGVTILKGVRVGVGSIIGAGSVVVGDVPPHVIVGGNPARILRGL